MPLTDAPCCSEQSVAEYLAENQPPEPVGAPHGLVASRFEMAARIMALDDPSESLVELADWLTCPRGCA